MNKRTKLPSVTAKGGARWTRAQAEVLLEQWRDSGESLSAFARRKGIYAQRLAWWSKRVAPATVSPAAALPSTFIPVTIRGLTQEAPAAIVEVGAVRVELRALDAASAAWVSTLARALGGAS